MFGAVKTQGYGMVRIKEINGICDVLLETQTIGGREYNIYLGYCGYKSFYAVEKN